MKLIFPLLFFVSLLPLVAQDDGVQANQKLRASIQKWILVMKEIHAKKSGWQDQKEVLRDSKTSLEAENAQMETEILASFERLNSQDQTSKDKLAEKKKFDDGRQVLLDGLNDLEPHISEIIPLLPKELASQSKVEKAIADHQNFALRKDKTKISLNARLTAALTILTEAEKFNQIVTPFTGRSAEAGGQTVLLDGIYFGLAFGFAANEEGTVAIHLKPSPSGWSETEVTDPATIKKIRELIDVGNASGPVNLVSLPLEIAE